MRKRCQLINVDVDVDNYNVNIPSVAYPQADHSMCSWFNIENV